MNASMESAPAAQPTAGSRRARKTNYGYFFEDFEVGQVLRHATPRTLTEGDVAAYHALYGSRFAIQSSDEFARAVGLPCAPVDDLLTFRVVAGKAAADLGRNALDELTIGNGRYGTAVYPGDTLSAVSTVTGLAPRSGGDEGVVQLETTGRNQDGEVVLCYERRVAVRRRGQGELTGEAFGAALPEPVDPAEMVLPHGLRVTGYDFALAGAPHRWGDYEVGECIDHIDGTVLGATDDLLAARLCQCRATVQVAPVAGEAGPFEKRAVQSGHVLSVARALSFNGLENGFRILAINRADFRHPALAGDTIYACSHVVGRFPLPDVSALGGLRLRLLAFPSRVAAEASLAEEAGGPAPEAVVDFDYTVALPR